MQCFGQSEVGNANVNSLIVIDASKLPNIVDRQSHYCCNYMELFMSHYLCAFDQTMCINLCHCVS